MSSCYYVRVKLNVEKNSKCFLDPFLKCWATILLLSCVTHEMIHLLIDLYCSSQHFPLVNEVLIEMRVIILLQRTLPQCYAAPNKNGCLFFLSLSPFSSNLFQFSISTFPSTATKSRIKPFFEIMQSFDFVSRELFWKTITDQNIFFGNLKSYQTNSRTVVAYLM